MRRVLERIATRFGRVHFCCEAGPRLWSLSPDAVAWLQMHGDRAVVNPEEAERSCEDQPPGRRFSSPAAARRRVYQALGHYQGRQQPCSPHVCRKRLDVRQLPKIRKTKLYRLEQASPAVREIGWKASSRALLRPPTIFASVTAFAETAAEISGFPRSLMPIRGGDTRVTHGGVWMA